MTDIVTWFTDVLAISFTIGTVTISLGELAVGLLILGAALSMTKRLMGRR